MGRYLKFFKDIEKYNTFTESDKFLLPNVSYVEGYEDKVLFHPYIPQEDVVRSRVRMTFNVTENKNLAINTLPENVLHLYVDGVEVPFDPVVTKTVTYEPQEDEYIMDITGTTIAGYTDIPLDYLIDINENTVLKCKIDDNVAISKNLYLFMAVEIGVLVDGEIIAEYDKASIGIDSLMKGGFCTYDTINRTIIVNQVYFEYLMNNVESAIGVPVEYFKIGIMAGEISSDSTSVQIYDGKVYRNIGDFLYRKHVEKWLIQTINPEDTFDDDINVVACCNLGGTAEIENIPLKNALEYECERINNNTLEINTLGFDFILALASVEGASAFFSFSFQKTDGTVIPTKQIVTYNIGGLQENISFNVNGEHIIEAELKNTILKPFYDITKAYTNAATIVNYEMDGITEISERCFSWNINSIDNLIIPNSVLKIDKWAFANCNGVKELTFNEGLETLERSVFYYRQATLDEIIELPNSLRKIPYQTFEGCRQTISIKLGNDVTEIGDRAFTDCDDLTSITIMTPKAPTLIGKPFGGVFPKNGTLYVPIGATGYEAWLTQEHLGQFNWTIVEI